MLRLHPARCRWPLLLGILFLVGACAPQPVAVTREPVSLHLVAAESCGPLAARAAEAYGASRPWVTVHTEVFNTALAEEVLREDGADIAMLTWPWDSPGEEGALWMAGFARDAVAVIVHPESPMLEIGLLQLREIYAGRLQDWGNMAITVVSREDGSGTRAAFESIVLDGTSTTLNAVVMPSSESMVAYVGDTPGAIGYVSVEQLGDGVRVLPIEGILPTREAIAEGGYPLWRQLFLASSGEPRGEAREFAQWLLAETRVELPTIPAGP